jgi:hypothetical protein
MAASQKENFDITLELNLIAGYRPFGPPVT